MSPCCRDPRAAIPPATLAGRRGWHNLAAHRRRAVFAAALATLALASCGSPGPRRERAARQTREPFALPVRVLGDSGSAVPLVVRRPPEVRAWVSRVTPARPPSDLAHSVPPEEAPGTEFDPLETRLPDPPRLEVDEGLRPPIPRGEAVLRLQTPRRDRPAWVELEVRVDESGLVSDALWSGGSDDSLLVSRAIEAALGLRFFPALQAGRPVAVWCRQRFDFGAAGR